MARWRRDEAERSWLRHSAIDAKRKGEGGGEASRTDATVDKCRNEMVDRVARYGFD